MTGNIRGWIGFSSSGKGKTKNIVLSSKKREGRIQNFCKTTDDNHVDVTGILAFPPNRLRLPLPIKLLFLSLFSAFLSGDFSLKSCRNVR